ncbi:MAG TPA: hypothetical protein PLP05_07425, partial [Sedimentisphaerales bacterium]|nr:hypothetical protein [Sedimentisphaerales bacterium]
MVENMTEFDSLPANAQSFIKSVIKKIRYRKKVRADVFEEIVSHFTDQLEDINDITQRQQAAEKLIADFGQPDLLAKLIRRGKKRCRPLWKKVLIVSFQTTCILVLFIGLRISTFYIGKPSIKIDYGKWLTEKASAGKDPNLNAKIDIDRAIELADFDFDKITWILNILPEDMNDVQLQQAKKYLVENTQTINALRDAANKLYFWVDYDNPDYEQVSLHKANFIDGTAATSNDYMETLSNWRHLAGMMALNIRIEVYSGQTDQAIKDWFVLQKFAGFFQGQGFLVDQLVAMGIEGLSCNTINDVLSHAEVSQSQLVNIQEYFEKNVKKDKRVINWIGEKALWFDEIQRAFTDNGQGDGRVLANGLRFIAKDNSSFIRGFVLGGYHGKKETIDEIEKFFNQVDSFSQQTPFQRYQQQLKITSNLFVFNTLTAPYEQIAMISWRLRTSRLALLTTIAIKRYQQETRQLPASLQQLVDSGYLDELPMDPFSDGPLIYKTTKDDFVLYSVGIDCKDNGGKIEYLDNGRVKGWKGE